MKFLLIPLILLFITCKPKAMNPDQTIKSEFNFEIEKYLGTWYEIARFDHSFERGLQGVTATYSMRKDGKIKVENQGYKGSINGKQKTAIGKAKQVSKELPRNLKVSFFWNFYAPYNILELDENYQHVLIGSNSSNYLWILSRTPKMEPKVLEQLILNARNRGYDTSKLIFIDQK